MECYKKALNKTFWLMSTLDLMNFATASGLVFIENASLGIIENFDIEFNF